ncbi:ABC transporter permease [Puia sp. P3]|uniref:ABC transporter permease n=1 Tax=Puia sp. P3 TaxID=3423952 RepID=UPI003D672561
MFKNYIRSALRSFLRNKAASCINVLGLSIGISAALIIFMLVAYDYSFDRWEPENNRIYRIVSQGDGWKNSGVPAPLPRAFARNSAGIQTVTVITQYKDWNTKVTVPGGGGAPLVLNKERRIVFADSSYFSIFPHVWLEGSAAGSLREPGRLVLTESRARLYFPGVPVSKLVGRTVVFSDTLLTTVAGVVKDLGANSDFAFGAFISSATMDKPGLRAEYLPDNWDFVNSWTIGFVKLFPGVAPGAVEKQLAAVFHSHVGESKDVHRLQALSEIHTSVEFDGKVNMQTVRNLILLAVFLLVLGAINFINLSTAHAAERAKEIGIRKTLGGQKGQLIVQFLSETFVLTLIAAVVSVLMAPLLLRVFSGFMPEGLKFDRFMVQPMVWGFCCCSSWW